MIINDVQFNAELSDILDELVAQLRANGIQLIQKRTETSDHIQICCPYHADGMERRPSAGITKHDIRMKSGKIVSAGTFHCFACQEVHSLPEVISHCFGHNDTMGEFGWRWLIRNFATVAREERKSIDIDLGRNHRENKTDTYVTEEELEKYRYYHPYWSQRKIKSEWLIELFDLGYDKVSRCITFPVRDIHGNCLFVARRNTKTKWFNYPKGTTKPLYGLYELSRIAGWFGNNLSNITGDGNVFVGLNWNEDVQEVIICESMLDALTCWEYGKYALALNGTGDDWQFQQLQELPCRKLILATDNDEAGRKARRNIRSHVHNKIITEYEIPDGKKDMNDLTQEEFDNLCELF